MICLHNLWNNLIESADFERKNDGQNSLLKLLYGHLEPLTEGLSFFYNSKSRSLGNLMPKMQILPDLVKSFLSECKFEAKPLPEIQIYSLLSAYLVFECLDSERSLEVFCFFSRNFRDFFCVFYLNFRKFWRMIVMPKICAMRCENFTKANKFFSTNVFNIC